ncbi:MAG: hypothetical protein AAF432_16785 [Planctomycetota bacterium]
MTRTSTITRIAQTTTAAFIVATGVYASASTSAAQSTVSRTDGMAKLTQTLQAHGGLDRWNAIGQLQYTVPDFPLGAKAPMNFRHIADVKLRRHLMVSDDYRLGFDGNNAWAINGDAAGIPARFVTHGNSYFVMMPFVFADAGATVTDLGTRYLDGATYDALGVSYADGDTADDDYVLFIDQQTRRLKLIHFTVTYAAIRGDTPVNEVPRKALVFDNWQDVDGLLLPQKATFYGWADETLQGDGNSFTVTNAVGFETRPNASIFDRPSDADIDATHIAN